MKTETLLEWITVGEVGISSKTMWAALMGTIPDDAHKGFNWDVPHDPDDFYRCLGFIRSCRLSMFDLDVIKLRVPWFAPIIDNWEELVRLFDEESPAGRCPKLYDLLRELEDRAMELDGWARTSPYSWERKS